MTGAIHLVHKPVGPTSFSIVRKYLNAARSEPAPRTRRICHGGTLDPFACGLLLILVEPATRLFDYLHDIPKTYEATVRWGVETDSGDLLGQPASTGDSSNLTVQQLEEVIRPFVGWQDQVPPPTSAKWIDGERAYVRVHRGENVVMRPAQVYLHTARWLSHDLPRESRLEVVVRGGYYIRALARDLGRKLGCGAHLTQLRRTAIGPWNDPGLDRTIEVHGRDILPWAPMRLLSDQEVGELRHGRVIDEGTMIAPTWSVPGGFPEPDAPIRAFHQDRFCFLLQREEGKLKKITALRGGL